jgi:seryl-tRNA synthetase
LKKEIVKITNFETSAIEHCNADKMKKYNDQVIVLNDISLPYSTVTLKAGGA